MRNSFILPYFTNSELEIETSIWTGRSKIWKDSIELERFLEKGKPFLIESESGGSIKMYTKATFTEFTPSLEIDGVKYSTEEKLPRYHNTLFTLPMLLAFLDGSLSGGIGAVVTVLNLKTFRTTTKYLKVFAIICTPLRNLFTDCVFNDENDRTIRSLHIMGNRNLLYRLFGSFELNSNYKYFNIT